MSTPENEVVAEAKKRRKPSIKRAVLEGLGTGGLAATVAGPIGLGFGLVRGVGSYLREKSFIDSAAAREEQAQAEVSEIRRLIEEESVAASPTEKRALELLSSKALRAQSALISDDDTTRLRGMQILERLDSDFQNLIAKDDDQARQIENEQRALITSFATDMRSRTMNIVQRTNQNSEQIQSALSRLSDSGFDPEKPSNRAFLSNALAASAAQLYFDAPDMLDAAAQAAPAIGGVIGAIGGLPGAVVGNTVGSLAQALTTALKSSDFKISREEWNNYFLAIQNSRLQSSQRQLGMLGNEATNLDAAAKRIGMLPEELSFKSYISGAKEALPPTLPMRAVRTTTESGSPIQIPGAGLPAAIIRKLLQSNRPDLIAEPAPSLVLRPVNE